MEKDSTHLPTEHFISNRNNNNWRLIKGQENIDALFGHFDPAALFLVSAKRVLAVSAA